ncbi:DNA-deoxyinosine glycosylase, partial [Nocardioides sp.]|uniref:DNA-deoxyinosine glycosylase n=1 Tax=Nocardioides sp. TaxID=35761 RepID=UPI00351880CA
MASPILNSFAPLVAPGARVLILGNMPGVRSLQDQQYYAHPRNAFWAITAELYGFDAAAPYPERVDALTGAGVAVWDVLRSCRRVGSLDASVEPDSMTANDFGRFFADHPTITRICFNGAAAEKNYRRLVALPHPPRQRLPSTSPAHTAAFSAKLAAWRAALTG